MSEQPNAELELNMDGTWALKALAPIARGEYIVIDKPTITGLEVCCCFLGGHPRRNRRSPKEN